MSLEHTPIFPDAAEHDAVCAEAMKAIRAAIILPKEGERVVEACICNAVRKAGAYTLPAIDWLEQQIEKCILHLPKSNPELAAKAGDAAHAAITHYTQKYRDPHRGQGHQIGRVGWRRGAGAYPVIRTNFMSCGTKRSGRYTSITRAEALAWGLAHCRPPAKPPRMAGPAGGTLAEARRAPGLWDMSNPIDEGPSPWQAGRRYSPGNPNAGFSPAILDPASSVSLTPSGALAPHSEDFKAVSVWGIKCQEAGSVANCEDPHTGLNRQWSVTGRSFTLAERITFLEKQCRPSCNPPPISEGAPADAVAKIRRVAPRNPAVKPLIKCNRSPLATRRPGVTIAPLPPITPSPYAAWSPPACTRDVVLGADCGAFASGWWFVSRGGVRMMVPNPNNCGIPFPDPCAR